MHTYTAPSRDGGAERTPLPPSEHTQQLAHTKQLPDKDRLKLLRNLTFSYTLTCAQAAEFVAEFEFSDAKQEAAALLHPALSDPSSFSAVLAKLRFESERAAVRQQLGLSAAPAPPPAAPAAPPPAAAARPARDEVSWMKKKPAADSDDDDDEDG